MSKVFEEIKKLMEDKRECLTRSMSYKQSSSYKTDQVCSKRNINLSLESLLLDDVDMPDNVDTDSMNEYCRQESEMSIDSRDEECDASPSEQDSGLFSSSDFSLSSSTSSLFRDVSTSSLSRGVSTTSLPRDVSTSSLSRDVSTSSLSKGVSTSSLPRDVSTTSLSRKESTGSTTSMNTSYGYMQDFVIVHTDGDEENADKCREDISEDLKEENVTIDIFSEIDLGTLVFGNIESLHSKYRYILIYVSKDLVDDKKYRLLNEILLTIGLNDKSHTPTSKRDRVIPIFTAKGKCGILELDIIHGIKYYQRNDKRSKRYISSIQNLLKSAREKFPL